MKSRLFLLYTLPMSGVFCLLILWQVFHTSFNIPLWENLMVHSTVEALGMLSAILMSFALLQRLHDKENAKLFFVAMGFLSMGILDGFHAILPPNKAFVFLHSIAGLAGGIGFVLVWFSEINQRASGKSYIPKLIVVITIAIGIKVLVSGESLPVMLKDGEFTLLAILINLLAGGLFFIAAIKFLIDFYKESKIEDYLLAFLSILFGFSAVLFKYSTIWDDGWWLWHFVRLAAYALTLWFLIREYYEIQEELIQNSKYLEKQQNKLEVTNEELKVQTTTLKESEEKLITKQKELEFTNIELEEKRKSLEDQKSVIEQKNRQHEINNWLKTGQSGLDNCMRGEQNIDNLSRNIITFICKYLNAEIGVLFLNNGNDIFQIMASYAYKPADYHLEEFKLGESLLGQAAREQQPIVLKDVPEDYVYVSSAIGKRIPKNIIAYPFTQDKKVVGVYELGLFNEITEIQMQLLESIAGGIAITINSTQARIQLNKLLEKTKLQAEELQLQQEELETSNEELRVQADTIQKSEAKLIMQQEELRVTNVELEEKTQFLEAQKKEINEKNKGLVLAQEELETKAKQLETTSKYKSEFLANMSHELRTPLNSLLILSQQLAQNKKNNLDSRQLEAAEIIYSSGNDLLNLINEILDLSKVESGKMSVNNETIFLKSISTSINNHFKLQAEEKGLKLEINVDLNGQDRVISDRQRLEQIIKNLISNAIKFTDKGGIAIKFFKPKKLLINRQDLQNKEVLAISVSDTGVGIPKEKHHQIFEAFQQLDGSTSRKYGGTGLGLSISRELAMLLGGEIHLKSVEKEGSTFTLYIPMEPLEKKETSGTNGNGKSSDKKQVELKEAGKNNSVKKQSIPDDRSKIKEKDKVILVIEDDIRFAKTLYNFCQSKKFKCIHAIDGETGLELVTKYPVNAIILDIRLPGIEGWEVLDQLKNNSKTRHIPVHIISVEEGTIEARKKGAIGFVTKPVKEEQLNETFLAINRLISKKLKNLLVIEDDELINKRIIDLLGNEDVKITTINNGKDALSELKKNQYECVILDLVLPDISGFEILESLEKTPNISVPPIIIYTAKDLTNEEAYKLHKYTNSIIIKSVKSEERLFDEASLFLHRVIEDLPNQKQEIISTLHNGDHAFKDKKILIVDDDMRNVFAISQILEEKGIAVVKAANGKMAIEILVKEKGIDLVLMDIMMPVMDGHEAISKIREINGFQKLPILALTAKAMKEDRKKCIDSGANDYLTKPVDVDKLFSLLRVWLYN